MLYDMTLEEQIMAHGFGTLVSGFPVYTFVLKEKIINEALVYGVNKAMGCHPLFCTRLTRIDGKYFWKHNDLPPVIRHWSTESNLAFGGKETNYYPWTVFYKDNTLYYTSTHAIADGDGALTFLKTMFYYYFEYTQQSIPQSSLVSTLENISKEKLLKEIELTHEVFGTEYVQAFNSFEENSVISINEKYFKQDTEIFRGYKISLDVSDIMADSKKNEVTQFASIGYFLLKAMLPLVDVQKGKIKLTIALNARKIFNSTTTHNFSISLPLCIDVSKFGSCSEQVLKTALRSQLDLKSDESSIKEQLYGMHCGIEMLNQNPEMLDQLLQQSLQAIRSDKANIIYTHLTKLNMPKEMEDKFDDMYIGGNPSKEHMFLVCGATFKERINLTIYQPSKNDLYYKTLCDLLKESNINFSASTLPPYCDANFYFAEP